MQCGCGSAGEGAAGDVGASSSYRVDVTTAGVWAGGSDAGKRAQVTGDRRSSSASPSLTQVKRGTKEFTQRPNWNTTHGARGKHL